MSRWKRRMTTYFLALCMVISLMPSGFAVEREDLAEPEETSELEAGPVAEEAPEPVAEEAPEPVAEEAPEPAAEEAPEPASEEAPEPASEEAPEPAAEEAPEPASEEAAEPASEKAPEPASEEAAELEAGPIEEKAPAEPETEGEKEGGPEEDRFESKTILPGDDYASDEDGKASLAAEIQVPVSDGDGPTLWTDSTDVGAGDVVRYTYTPTVTGIYTFESVNGAGDSVGWVTTADDSNTILVQNDDGGSSYNFRLSIGLTARTTYYFYARWYSSSSSGTMECQMTRSGEIASIQADGSVHEITIETAGDVQYFSFTPSESGIYVFESVNESGDTYGYLYDAEWSCLSSNDDGGNGYNFRISDSLQGGTTYYFGARWYSSSRTDGTISVKLSGSSAAKTLAQPSETEPVTDYEEITTAGERKYFSFTPTVTGTYVLESTNTSYDPVGELYASDKSTRLATNDDGGSGYNFRLSYDLTAGTTYYYAVRFYGASATGRIDVRFSLGSGSGGSVVPVVLSAQEVALKGFTTDSINPADSSNPAVKEGQGYFSFTPEVSGTYLFESTNESGDPAGRLYAAIGGAVTAQDDDNGSGNNFCVSYELSRGTTYYYAARWYSSSANGTISVRIRRALGELASPLTPGADASANIDELGRIVYFQFTPSATGEYTFESTSYPSGFDPYVSLYDGDYSLLASNDDGGDGLNFRLTRTLDAGTPYYFAVKRLNDSSTGEITVRLSGNSVTAISASDVAAGSWTGTANITTAGSYAYYSFTPQTSDTYIFESTLSSGDTVGVLYSGVPGSDTVETNDDGGEGYNFRITRALTAGTTYYFGVRWYSTSRTGEISLRMTKETSESAIVLDAAAVESSGSTTYGAGITTGGQIALFSFTPRSSGSYVFDSTNTSLDPYGYFYGTSAGGSASATNDDGGSGLNFRLAQDLTAGTTYYFGAKLLYGNTGTINVRMSKAAADVPVDAVSVTLSSSTIYAGNQATATARITPSNATNQSVTWSSSSPGVATVSSGIITGVSAGTATITARTSNGKTGSATITVQATANPDPDPGQKQYSPDYRYSFWNSNSGFDYPSNYRIPVERYMQLGYTRQQAESLYRSNGVWGGNCFGMSISSILFFMDVLHEENYDSSARVPHDFRSPCSGKLRDMIELFQESQSMPIARYDQRSFDAGNVYAQVSQGIPVKIGIGGHAVVVYSGSYNGSTYTFNIYDNADFVDTLTYTSSTNYRFTRNGSAANSRWYPANYLTAERIETVYRAIKDRNSNGAANLLSVDGQDYVYIFCPMVDMTLENAQGQTASITNHILTCPDGMDINLVLPDIPMDDDGSWEDGMYRIVVPADTYSLTGLSTATIVGTDLSVDVTSSSSAPIVFTPDLRSVAVQTANGDTYSVTYSVYNDYFDTLNVHGTAGENVGVILHEDQQEGDHVDVSGARTIIADVTVSDKHATVEDTFDLDQKPTPFSVWWPVSGEGDNQSVSLQIRYEDAVQVEPGAEKSGTDNADDANGKGSQIAGRSRTEAPTFSEPALNQATNNLEVTINKPDGAVVYYYVADASETDLRDPTEEDEIYSAPIVVTPSMQIVAIASKLGCEPSEAVKWQYMQAVGAMLEYYGDLDGDGEITVREITRIIMARSLGQISEVILRAADLDGDGEITVREITRIILARSLDRKIERT